MSKQPHDTSTDDDLAGFNTVGTSIDDAFEGLEIEDDFEDIVEDSFDDIDED